MININWRFSRGELQKRLSLEAVHLLNDFAALAWALPALGPEDVFQAGGGTVVAGGTKAVPPPA